MSITVRIRHAELRRGVVNGDKLRGTATFATGGGTGIGFARAEAIVNAGGKVAIAGHRVDVLNTAV